jgi:RimJ/RimL family protein N-acetyltransferase
MSELEEFQLLLKDMHIREFLMEGQDVTQSECSEFIAKGETLLQHVGLGLYLASSDQEIVGYCGFMETHPPSENLDVVYAFSKKQTGKGFATETCNCLVELFMKSGYGGDLTAVVHPKNVASIKVLERNRFANLGFADGELSHLLRFRLQKF